MKAQGRYWMTAIAFSLSFGPMTGFASESETAIEQPLQLQEQLVQKLMKREWSAQDLRESAEALGALQHQKRWQKEALRMLGACADAKACHAQEMKAALRVMEQASHHADRDVRRFRRQLERAILKERGVKGEVKSAKALEARLQMRLGLNSQPGACSGDCDGESEQKRQTYMQRVGGEEDRGGRFGTHPANEGATGRGVVPGR